MRKPVPETDFNLDHLRTTALPPARTHRWSVHLTFGGRVESAHVTREEADARALETGGHVRDRAANAKARKSRPRELSPPIPSERYGEIHPIQMREHARIQRERSLPNFAYRLPSIDTHPWGVRGGAQHSLVSAHEERQEAEQKALEYGGKLVDRRVLQEIGRSAASRRYER